LGNSVTLTISAPHLIAPQPPAISASSPRQALVAQENEERRFFNPNTAPGPRRHGPPPRAVESVR
jgi:hypothetical protein